ncbi:XkdF-like putative serine protease domain-containing protein [Pontibacter mangrovi]|uniref:Uncharacterized protein n=1 Tax=Pontibacter mangrovi TaxID=2589816 RepID=A0A501W880_9BACT|nr:XkdF-like putative serine protease domain-containing protein [Pontibacter mangrovi]TPE44932.1 hypothetical protein FJM65_07920 [Pontibacter mangrovi]
MKRKSQAPVFAISIDDTDEKTGVNLISFVSRPAIEADFVALSQSVKLAQDKHKQILTGPVLIPDKKIFRLTEDEEPFYIQFDADTIERIRNKFHKNNFTHATNDEHELALDGNYVVESWLISDAEKDKAVALGLSDLPVGTWMVSYRVEDADYWEKEILSGNKRGFSLEGLFDYEEVKEQLSKTDTPDQDMKKPKGWFQRMSALKLSTIELEDGTVIVHDPITNKLFNSDNTYLESGTYKTKQGVTFKVETSTSVYQWFYQEPEKLAQTEMKKPLKKPGLIARMMAKLTAFMALATMTLEDGSTIEVDDETKEVFSLSEEGERGEPLADGTYTLEDGTTIEVAEGKLKEAAPEEDQELSKAQARIAELEKQLSDANASKLSAEQKATELEAKLKAEEDKATKLSAEKQELEVKLKKKPGAELLKMGGDKEPADERLSPAQVRLAEVRSRNKKK